MSRLSIMLDGAEVVSLDLVEGNAVAVSADDLARVERAIRKAGRDGIRRSDLWQSTARHVDDLPAALAALMASGVIAATKAVTGKAGPRVTTYRAVRS